MGLGIIRVSVGGRSGGGSQPRVRGVGERAHGRIDPCRARVVAAGVRKGGSEPRSPARQLCLESGKRAIVTKRRYRGDRAHAAPCEDDIFDAVPAFDHLASELSCRIRLARRE